MERALRGHDKGLKILRFLGLTGFRVRLFMVLWKFQRIAELSRTGLKRFPCIRRVGVLWFGVKDEYFRDMDCPRFGHERQHLILKTHMQRQDVNNGNNGDASRQRF